LYNPETQTRVSTGYLRKIKSVTHVVTLLNGKVLALGFTADHIAGAELYDPTTKTWTATQALGVNAYIACTLISFSDNKVLMIGGMHNCNLYVNGSIIMYKIAILYDSKKNTWETIKIFGPYANGSNGCLKAISLPDDRVLVVDECVCVFKKEKNLVKSETYTCEVWFYEQSKLTAELKLNQSAYVKHANLLNTRKKIDNLKQFISTEMTGVFEAVEPRSGQ